MTIESQHDAAADDLAPDSGEYRVLSPWAIAGLVLGLASAVAFAHPVLWMVPILGLAASLLALRQISREAPEVSGRKAALWGLSLSVAFGSGAICDRAATRWWIEH